MTFKSAFIRGVWCAPTITDLYAHVPPEHQRYGGAVTYSIPTGTNDWISQMWLMNTQNHIVTTCNSDDREWYDVFAEPPPYHHEPKLRDIKTSASVAILVEYMPDTTVRNRWYNERVPYMNEIVSVARDIATDRIETQWLDHPDRRYNITYSPRTFKDEPHWFKHDRKARR